MAEGNGVTRREFDRLESRVDLLFDKGSPQVQALERQIAIELREIRDDVRDVNRRIANLFRLGWALLMALIVGLVSLLSVVASGSF